MQLKFKVWDIEEKCYIPHKLVKLDEHFNVLTRNTVRDPWVKEVIPCRLEWYGKRKDDTNWYRVKFE